MGRQYTLLWFLDNESKVVANRSFNDLEDLLIYFADEFGYAYTLKCVDKGQFVWFMEEK